MVRLFFHSNETFKVQTLELSVRDSEKNLYYVVAIPFDFFFFFPLFGFPPPFLFNNSIVVLFCFVSLVGA